ncbi:MAG TPA: YdcF family protein [Chloroflexota bacterium]|nr:YdcF family protein [Chloroflexota bacterium]
MPRHVILRGALLVALVVAVSVWFLNAGTLLIDAEPPEPSDVIVVLAGNAPDRLLHAEELRQQGLANLLLVSNERVHTHGLETTWLDLYHAGVSAPELPPASLIVLDDPPPESTIDEARRAADVLSNRGLHSALLVTDAFHSRRANLLFQAAFAHRGLTVRSAPAADYLDLAHWWSHPVAARRVAEEWTKMAVYLVQGAYW